MARTDKIRFAKNYLEAYSMDIGLLVNFGANSVEVKRIVVPVQ